MCNCAKRYSGEEGKEKIKDLAQKSKTITGDRYAIAQNKTGEYYYILYSDAIGQNIEIIEDI